MVSLVVRQLVVAVVVVVVHLVEEIVGTVALVVLEG
jgi:hypothetical protein